MNSIPISPASMNPASMNIVYAAPFGLRRKTSVWARTLPLAQHLVALGHQATILIPSWDSPEDAGAVTQEAGVVLEQVRLRGGTLPTVARMLRRIDALRPDIVHVVKPRAHAGLVQWWRWQRRNGRRMAGSRLVLDVDDWEQAWTPINRYPWPLARALAWQEEWGIRHAHAYTAASRWLIQKLEATAPHAPRLYLPNGVVPPRQPAAGMALPTETGASAGADAPQILFFSRAVEIDPAWLAECWRRIRDTHPTAKLLWAGEPVQPHLAAAYERHLLSLPGVQRLGYVDRDHLPHLYGQVSCAIFPADPIPLHQAKCSVRLATTLLHGVPVVASAVGEQAAYGANGAAHLVSAGASPAAFAEAVLQVLADPAQARAMVERAHRCLQETYSWAHLAKTLEAFYTNLLSTP